MNFKEALEQEERDLSGLLESSHGKVKVYGCDRYGDRIGEMQYPADREITSRDVVDFGKGLKRCDHVDVFGTNPKDIPDGVRLRAACQK